MLEQLASRHKAPASRPGARTLVVRYLEPRKSAVCETEAALAGSKFNGSHG